MSAVSGKNSWKGLFGCLGVGMVVVGAAVFWVFQVQRMAEQKLARIDREFLQPWAEAVRGGAMESAWRNLTTDQYRRSFPRGAVESTYHDALLRFGLPVRATLHGQTGTKTPGSPYLYRTATEWEWESGETLRLLFHLVDVPGEGYRVDRAGIGTLTKSMTGYHPPEGTPDGPW